MWYVLRFYCSNVKITITEISPEFFRVKPYFSTIILLLYTCHVIMDYFFFVPSHVCCPDLSFQLSFMETCLSYIIDLSIILNPQEEWPAFRFQFSV